MYLRSGDLIIAAGSVPDDLGDGVHQIAGAVGEGGQECGGGGGAPGAGACAAAGGAQGGHR